MSIGNSVWVWYSTCNEQYSDLTHSTFNIFSWFRMLILLSYCTTKAFARDLSYFGNFLDRSMNERTDHHHHNNRNKKEHPCAPT